MGLEEKLVGGCSVSTTSDSGVWHAELVEVMQEALAPNIAPATSPSCAENFAPPAAWKHKQS